MIEVVVATLVMAAVAIPLFGLFQSGIRTTHATIHEVQGVHLAAELAEQVETIPFDELGAAVPSGERRYSSQDGTLEDGVALGPAGFAFRVTPLPRGFSRRLRLVREEADLILAESEVGWSVGDLPVRQVLLRRYLARDGLLPP
jgi:hypothetical protein